MQAIVTKYLGPTNNRGGRVKAFCDVGNVTLSWNHAADIDVNHENAFNALVSKLGWQDYKGIWSAGTLPQKMAGGIKVYVFTPTPF